MQPDMAWHPRVGRADNEYPDGRLRVILAATFGGIFTEAIHGIHRAKIAVLGAGAMVFLGQFLALRSRTGYRSHRLERHLSVGCDDGDCRHYDPYRWIPGTGILDCAFSRGRQYYLLVLLGTAVTVFSLLLDNVTTVIVFGPLILIICQVLGVSPLPYLMAAALSRTPEASPPWWVTPI